MGIDKMVTIFFDNRLIIEGVINKKLTFILDNPSLFQCRSDYRRLSLVDLG